MNTSGKVTPILTETNGIFDAEQFYNKGLALEKEG